MRSAIPRWLPAVACAVAAITPENALAAEAHAAKASELVTVHVADGRAFRGQVDVRSGPRELWLRTTVGTATLRRPIQWSAVARVATAVETFTAEEFRARLDEYRSVAADNATRSATATALSVPGKTRNGPMVDGSPHEQASERSVLPVAIQVDASIANWDADPEPDGVLVHVAPVDVHGQLVAVDATIEAEVLAVSGRRRASPRSNARGRDDLFPVIARSSHAVTSRQFGARGATIRVPFDAVHPEFDPTVRTVGAVVVRASIAGVGVLSATADAVGLRSPSVVRNRHEAAHGTRTLPGESAGTTSAAR